MATLLNFESTLMQTQSLKCFTATEYILPSSTLLYSDILKKQVLHKEAAFDDIYIYIYTPSL